MDTVILHADANSYYVSCEMSENPRLRGKAVIVGGDVEARHGIVLAKSDLAKKAGVKTGMALWQAKQCCPNLISIPANYRLYLRMSREMRAIFGDYTGKVQPFGLDECWLGLGRGTLEQGRMVADEIRKRMWDELGITASVGVADNKIYAKLGSDYRKPDATTVFAPEDYERMVWPLPVCDLLYVGPSTQAKLRRININTIGDLARLDESVVRGLLGKNGEMLHRFASGQDRSPIEASEYSPDIKSIGNSTTAPRDLTSLEDIKLTMFVLAESVAQRLRENRFRARTVQIYIRDNELKSFERQTKLIKPSQLAHEFVAAGMTLFKSNYNFLRDKPIRSLGIRGTDLETADGQIQLSFLADDRKRVNLEILEGVVDDVRNRFGHFSIGRLALLGDRIGDINPVDDHVIHPISYM